MKIAFILYDGMTSLDFIGVFDPLTRLKTMEYLPDLAYDLCSNKEHIVDINGIEYGRLKIYPPLDEYDLIVIPGGKGNRVLMKDEAFLNWLRTISTDKKIATVCTGSLLLASTGNFQNRNMTTHPTAYEELTQLGVHVLQDRIVEDGNLISSGGVTAGIDLGLFLCEKISGESVCNAIRKQIDYPYTPVNKQNKTRQSRVSRRTSETEIEITLDLDGTGKHDISTGLPFFDHMLTQISVHGLFDLSIMAKGDLAIDPHHTIEDVGLALGQAFREALGDRVGIIRMASAFCPMDDSLAQATIDFSGRPYCVSHIEWKTPSTGNIPTSMFDHFLNSFANEARCNLHVQVFYGLDDHHQSEAVFKALARAMNSAVQVDPRRLGIIPSSKGILF